MKKRYTCITLFDEESLNKISNVLLKLKDYDLCKIPHLKEPYTVDNRKEADTLPYHFTLSHISIHADKDYNKLIKMRDIIMQDFKPFIISFDKLGLFEIYPARREL